MYPIFLNFTRKIDRIYLIIVLLSFIQTIYVWKRFAIGGDVMIPFSADVLEKYLYQWQSIQNGLYFSLNYLPLYVYYRFVELLGLNVHQVSFLLLFGINFFSGLGVYNLSRVFDPNEKKYLYVIPILLYLFSPALLNGWHYMYFYACIPWYFYFLFKMIKRREIGITDILLLSVVIFFSSLDLPNPKYLFYLFFATVVILSLAWLFKLIEIRSSFRSILGKFTVFFLISAYLLAPLAYFATNYSPEAYSVHTQAGYKDSGHMMDFGSATIDKMFRLYHNGLNLNEVERESYLSNKIIIILSYVFIALIILNVLIKKVSPVEIKYNYILLSVSIVFLFFAAGPNPPFGSLYEYFVRTFPLLAFLRTTAGAVFVLSLFYSLMLFLFLKSLPGYKKTVSVILGIAIFVVSYPLWDGSFYQNNSSVSKYADGTKHGLIVPEDYFKMKAVLQQKRLDSKIAIPKMDSSYMSADWGYFGPPLYNFLFKNNFISVNKIYTDIYNHNVGFILRDDYLVNDDPNLSLNNPKESVLVSRMGRLGLYTVPTTDYLPHLYVPEKIVHLNRDVEFVSRMESIEKESPSGRSVFFREQPSYGATIPDITENNRPVIEYKKINPIKYRVRFHSASGKFPLVFSENFNEGWKVYTSKLDYQLQDFHRLAARYKILDGNDTEQATPLEVVQFIDNGWVTSLGDGRAKEVIHKKWENDKEKLDYKERYVVDFISKKSHNTIQNNNLPNGTTWETWFSRPYGGNQPKNQFIANGFANSWFIDTEVICGETNTFQCVKNTDGTYDFELVVEFFPQRIAYLSLFTSLAAFCFCVVVVLARFYSRYFNIQRKNYDTNDPLC